MKHSERFENAVTKLYNAFHNGELDAMDSCFCAVGNMCDNKNEWHPYLHNYMGIEEYEKGKKLSIETGYSNYELLNIESIFMLGIKKTECRGKAKWMASEMTKETQFKGLCAVVEYLCELEGIPNIMDYQKLFESAKNKLEEVFV